ncbi:MAG: glycoside hydrolase family 3 protein [Lachnospiraceae bacterium]|nr:glycoside hydrolase family 3 protein [Lachnospiraceae bacterium]
MKKTKLWTALAGACSILLCLVLVGNHFATSYASMINKQLGVSSTRVVVDENAETLMFYETSFKDADGNRDDEALTAWQKALCEQIQGEGSVLLTNHDALPLEKGLGITAFGRSSSDIIYGGTGSGQVDTANAATLLSALTDAGFQVNTAMLDWYAAQINQMKEDGTNRSTAGMFAEYEAVPSATRLSEVPVASIEGSGVSYDGYKDVALVVLGRSGGEGSDLATGNFTDGESYFELQDVERELLSYVSSQGFGKIVVLINSSNALAVDWVEDPAYKIDACLWIGGPGQYGMNAVAQILNGDINPSGHLVDTFSVSSLSAPAMQNFGAYTYANADPATGYVGGQEIDGVPGDLTRIRYAIHYLVEEEGIYVGYKYYETRYEDAVLGQGNASGSAGTFASSGNWNYAEEVGYPFGYGLSYTTFEQTLNSVTYDAQTDSYLVEVSVKNSGSVAGKSVVQVYGQQPYTDFDRENRIEKAAVQLVGFEKTKLLAPGETEQVTVTVERKELTSYDSYVNKTYILEDGTYFLAIGDDAHDALNNILAAKGKTTADGMDADGDAAKTYRFEVASTDASSYAYSEANMGYRITNQFDEADLNYYGDMVTYLSRQDWEGTFPTSYEGLTATDEMIQGLQFNYTKGTEDADVVLGSTETSYNIAMFYGVAYDDPLWEDLLNQLTLEEMAEIVGHSGYGTSAIASVGLDATVSADGPQGIKGTYAGSATVAYTSEPVMAATFNRDLLSDMGKSMGEDALRSDSKIVGWYGPAMNIHRTPYSGRNFEYYSEDSFLSGVLAAEEVKTAQEMGLVSYIKHFALNDFETYRQSVATFATEQAIREIFLKSFQYAVEDGGARAVMTSFNRIGTRWAGAHKGLLTNVLRNEWGFTGVALTDAVMANRNWMDVSIGVEAGNDTWLSSGDWLVPLIQEWAANDSKLLTNLREASHRYLYAYANSSALNGMSANSHVEYVTPAWRQTLNIVMYTIGILTVLCFILSLIGQLKKKGGQ